MKPHKYLSETINQHHLRSTELTKAFGWKPNSNMIWQLKTGRRPISADHAVTLEIASGGVIQADKLVPDLFEKLKKIGFFRFQQSETAVDTEQTNTSGQAA